MNSGYTTADGNFINSKWTFERLCNVHYFVLREEVISVEWKLRINIKLEYKLENFVISCIQLQWEIFGTVTLQFEVKSKTAIILNVEINLRTDK